MRAEIRVTGIVQGVGFRPFVYRTAVRNRLRGYVRNLGDAGVDIVVEGTKDAISKFLSELRSKAPPQARIDTLKVRYRDAEQGIREFKILGSSDKVVVPGSVIPPDIAICENCMRELRDPKNRRFRYFFITCTDCGPRFTIINRLPYDRENTTMKDFLMCPECRREYEDPLDRRFHAQTVACPKCGPKVFLTDNEGNILDVEDPVSECGKLLEEGYIALVKGNGGFHIAASTLQSEPILKLRKLKSRRQKPFAVMARDVRAAKTFALIDRYEEELLTSPVRPIVLLKKREDYYLSEEISPGLHTIGVMLPYTGLHAMLFDKTCEPAFIMTSANRAGEPIVTRNEEAYKKFGSIADYFLIHDREIANRCDDSVVRMHSGSLRVLRRSRGYAPEPVKLKWKAKRNVLALGVDTNTNVCVLYQDKGFISQYVGDIEKVETAEFLEEAAKYLMKITNVEVEAVACDLHPTFNSARIAEKIAEELGAPLIKVQHHYAHIAGLAAEAGVRELIGICCDGFGYGLDGKAWGGEILYLNEDEITRLAHLQPQPMVGGDLAAKYPIRMVAGILRDTEDIYSWLKNRSTLLPHGEIELNLILKQLERGEFTETTSCGRILDAASALLDICHERTYEGEPAMKVEATAYGGRRVLKLKPQMEGHVLRTTELLEEVYVNLKNYSKRDLAFSVEEYIAEGVASLAVDLAKQHKVDYVGFSGGVAYNEHISEAIRKIVEKRGLKFVSHNSVPPGDGGVSFGQAVYAAEYGK